jgi:hypothetical protein
MRKSVRGFPPASRSNLLNLDHCHEFWLNQPKLIALPLALQVDGFTTDGIPSLRGSRATEAIHLQAP